MTVYLDSNLPIAFAHRGGDARAENALDAFAAVESLGYRYVETDVRTSKDGVPFVFHDASLLRVTGEDHRLSDLTAAQVRGLRSHGGRAIPSLQDTLRAFPDLRFNIDLKDDAAVEPVARIIEEESAFDRVCLTSFSDRRIRAARRRLGTEVCLGLGVTGATRAVLAAMVGTWIAGRGSQVLQIPLAYKVVPVATRRVVRTAHRLGLAVHVWTLNDRSSIEKALEIGVDGIMTDRPEVLKEALIRRDLWG